MIHITSVLIFNIFLLTSKDAFADSFDFSTKVSRTTIKVSSDGENNADCWQNLTQPCKTLAFALSKPNLNATTVILSNENHYLHHSISITDFDDLVLTTENLKYSPNIICTTKGGSFSFKRGRKLVLSSLLITDCGTNHTSTNKIKGKSFFLFAGLFLEDCVNVNLNNLKIYGSRGMGVVFYDVGGNVYLRNVTFADNKQIFPYKERGLSSGGGIYIEFTLQRGFLSTVYNTKANYTFHDCVFQNNVAENNFSYPSPADDPQNYVSFGRGGAVSLMLLGAAAKNRFVFNNCTFKNNTALWGAAIFAEFHGQSGDNVILINNCHFLENHASYGGGAIRTGLASNNSLGYNLITVSNCNFLKNHGNVGGAFSQYREEKVGMEKEVVQFENCIFMENTAYIGTALHMSVSQFELHNVVLSNNLVHRYKEATSGKGALYLFSSKGILKKGNRLENNKWTAVVIEFSSLEIYDNVTFFNNSGINGGAIATYAESWIDLKENSHVEFIGNSAVRQGGALYVKTPGPPMLPMDSTEFMVYKCVFLFGSQEGHPDNFKTKVRFINNTAPAASGSSVFISTLNWCRKYGEQKYNNTGLQWGNFIYQSQDSEPVIVTNPVIMELNKADWYPPPSIQFQPRIMLRDELWNSVYGTVRVIISSSSNNVLLKGSDVFAVRRRLPKISITGREGALFNVTMETVVGVTLRQILVNAKLDKCPIGYFQSADDTSCKCLSTKGMVKGVTRCRGLDVYILRGRWGNPKDKSDDFAKLHCPRNYCRKCAANVTDGIDCLFQEKQQCGENRKWDSVLCGSCKDGYSIKLGNEICAKCTNSSLAWLLLWFLLLTMFVSVILVINVRNYFTYLNAYLYSYQVLPLLLIGNHYLDVFIRFVIGLTNFSGTGGNFGVCLWDGMTDMQKMLLNYVTPFYILLCVGFFVFLSSYWKNCPFSTQSTLRALALLSTFAYADFTRITFELLHFVSVNGKNVLYIEGDVEVFKGRHIPYAVFAIIVLLVVVILFPLSLFFFHILIKYFVKLKGVIDAFQEPFKKGYERFAVFYLICRFVFIPIFVFVESGLIRDTLLAIACEIILIFFLFFKPYNEEKMNYFDMLMLSNITIIATINVSLDAITQSESRRGLQYTAVVLTYLPFLCIFLQFSYWAYMALQDCIAKRKNRPPERVRKNKKHFYIPERAVDDHEEERTAQYKGFDAQYLRGAASDHERDFDYHPYVGSEKSDVC